jgi:CO/xanthine dehydrogenase Mo-binding subunit
MGHARIDSLMVYTNQVPCGSMRSPGDPQSIFASEAQIDLIARALGMDPYAFRMHNLVTDGDVSALGHRWQNILATRTLEAAVTEAGYHDAKPEIPGRKVGRGMAIWERHIGAGTSVAKVVIDMDGAVTLYTPLRDTGSGFYTVLPQIIGEELGIPYNTIAVKTWTTDDTAFDTGVGGSRVTNVGGNAVYQATVAVRDKLIALAAQTYGWSADAITLQAGQIAAPGQTPVPLADLVRQSGAPVEGEYTHTAGSDSSLTVFCAQVAEVEVDEDTGQVTLKRFTTAHDVGTILNPIAHQGQIEGGVMQGIGQAMMEEVQYEDGQVTNLSLGEYKLPSMCDIPELRTVHVQSEGGPSPYGGKAIGEQPISAVAPAIVNAVLDATGLSIKDLPVTSEKVYTALQEAKRAASKPSR